MQHLIMEYHYTTQALRGPITKISQYQNALLPVQYSLSIGPSIVPNDPALASGFSRIINLLLTKLARDRTGRISALGLFCTGKTPGRYSPSTALALG